MVLIFDRVMSRRELEAILARNDAKVAAKSASAVIYRLSSGARAEVTVVPAGYRLRIWAPPGCACMK